MTSQQAKKLAAAIARDLMTPGNDGSPVDRLRLMTGDIDHGAWSQIALAVRIESWLTGKLPQRTAKQKRAA